MSFAMTRAVAAQTNDVAYGSALLAELSGIKRKVEHVEQEAERTRDWRILLLATKQHGELVKLQAELTGQVQGSKSTSVNVDVQVDEATAQRIVNAYLLTRTPPGGPALTAACSPGEQLEPRAQSPADASQEPPPCNRTTPTPKIN
jgi:hypothetical protein